MVNRTYRLKLLNAVACAMALFLIALPPAMALDTDIYLTTNSASAGDAPNVLIIMDTSGSMNTSLPAVQADYDPNIDYSLEPGTPGIPNGRVYWSRNGSTPSVGSNNWISVANNNCTTSQSYLDATGIYSGTRFLMWFPRSNPNRSRWSRARGGNDKIMDCHADGVPDAGGQYLASGSAGPYTTDSSKQFNWDSVSGSRYTLTLFSSNYMNYKHNPSLVGSTTRMEVAKSAINSLIASTSNVRFGLMVFNKNNDGNPGPSGNHGGRVVFAVDNMTPQRVTDMTAVVNALTPSGATPLAESMWEAYRYFAGQNPQFGHNQVSPVPPWDPNAENAGTGAYISPYSSSCQQAYVILITDGDPTSDTSADGYIGGLPGIGTLNGNRLDELAGWMYNHDLPTQAAIDANNANQRRAITYTIGFGTGISASGLQLLQNTATQGHGSYLVATDADSLSTQLRSTIIDILSVTTSFAAPALSINVYNSLYNRDDVYFAQFKPTSTTLWNGNVKKFKQCTDASNATCTFGELLDKNDNPAVDPATLIIKDTAHTFWSTVVDGNTIDLGGAGGEVPSSATRSVYTYTGGYDGTNKRIPTGTTDLSSTVNVVTDGNTALTQAMLGVTSSTERTTLINWMRGQDVQDYNNDGSTTDDRWGFADAVHSRPLTMTYGGTASAPVTKIFVGSNDGGLHMINESNGKEEWVFFPQELLGQLNSLQDDAVGNHPWGLDGDITAYIKDVDKDGIIEKVDGDLVHLFVTMRRGGTNIYALDVTPDSVLSTPATTGGIQPKLLWVIQGGVTPGYVELQQTWSKAKVTTIRYSNGTTPPSHSPKTVLIFGGGYDPVNDGVLVTPQASGNAVYIADLATGERLWWVSGTGSLADLELANMEYSIPSDVTVMDANGDGATDRLYVGDLAGQLWRIDLSPLLIANNNAGSSGYRFAALSGATEQESRKLYYPPDVAQVRDSKYSAIATYDLVTLATGDREDPLDSLTALIVNPEPVNNRIYAMRDYVTAALVEGSSLTYPSVPITESLLYDATANLLQNNPSATEMNKIKSAAGWYIDLIGPGSIWVGEKSLAKTSIFAGLLLVTTYEPPSGSPSSSCQAAAGDSYLYLIDVLNGTATVDIDGDGNIDADDRRQSAGVGLAPEAVISIRESGVSGLVGPASIKGLPNALPRKKTFWLQK